MQETDTVVTALENNRWKLDNGELIVIVDGRGGGSIVSAVLCGVDKEMMWRDNNESQTLSMSDTDVSFYDNYVGGMQELFPNAGPATLIDGAPLPFHGEACRIPWQVAAVDDELQMRVALRRYPFQLERKISLRPGEAVVDVISCVKNTSDTELPVHWGLHPVFAEDVTAAPAVVFGAFRDPTADASVFGPKQSVRPGAAMRMTEWGGRPVLPLFDANAGTSDLGYAAVDAGWFVIHSDLTGLTVGMTWPVAVFSDLWFWQECRSPARYPWWGRHHIVGIEPHSSSPSMALLDEVKQRSSLMVSGRETASAKYSLRFSKLEQSEVLPFVDLTAKDAQTTQSENREGVACLSRQ